MFSEGESLPKFQLRFVLPHIERQNKILTRELERNQKKYSLGIGDPEEDKVGIKGLEETLRGLYIDQEIMKQGKIRFFSLYILATAKELKSILNDQNIYSSSCWFDYPGSTHKDYLKYYGGNSTYPYEEYSSKKSTSLLSGGERLTAFFSFFFYCFC